MNANVKGMLYTAGAVVVGIVVAKMITKKLATAMDSTEG